MAYAEVSDIETRWRDLSTDEESRATALLDDASAMLEQLVDDIDVADSRQMALLKTVCCNMVIRAMSASEYDAFGASQMSMTAGPYTQQFTYSNPSGDMYLTKMEKRLLGVTSGYIGTIRPMIAGDHDD